MRRRTAKRPATCLLAACLVVLAATACEPNRQPPQPTATTPLSGPGSPANYLRDALNLIQANAYYADRVDWPSVRAEAQRRVAAATSTAGTYETLRWVLSKLGDRHSFLLTPDRARELTAGGGRGFGLVALFPERIVVDVEPGSGAARAGVRVGDRIQAVDGRPPAGTRSSPSPPRPPAAAQPGCCWSCDAVAAGGTQHLQVTVQAAELPSVRVPTARPLSARMGSPGAVRSLRRPRPRCRPVRLRRPRPPVAVLTSRLTGSAGEGVAMAFRGRPGARSFDEPTAGVPTGNSQHRLSDQTRIRPDQPVANDRSDYGTRSDPVFQAATSWLDARCS